MSPVATQRSEKAKVSVAARIARSIAKLLTLPSPSARPSTDIAAFRD